MFDKNKENTYTKRFLAAFTGVSLLFAFSPIVIAQPLVLPMLPVVQDDTIEMVEEEDPASANRYFIPTTVTETLILNHANRLEVNAFELKEQLYALADMTEHIESDNKRHATNPYSGAMSYYQFLPSSVDTAVVRLESLMRQYDMGPAPAWAKRVQSHPEELYALSRPQQRLLMLANIMNQKSANERLVILAQGNDEMAKEIYYIYHHTSPDQATKTRTERLHPIYFTDKVASI